MSENFVRGAGMTLHNFRGYQANLPELIEKAREIRKTKPDRFSVKKLAVELKVCHHTSSLVYYKILRGG